MNDSAMTVAYHPIPWNKGKLIGQKPPLKLREIWALRTRLEMAGKTKELALFNLAIDSKLRGCDLVQLRVNDVAPGGEVLTRASVIQQKTRAPVRFELTEPTGVAVAAWTAVSAVQPARLRGSSVRRPQPRAGSRKSRRRRHDAAVCRGGPPASGHLRPVRRKRPGAVGAADVRAGPRLVLPSVRTVRRQGCGSTALATERSISDSGVVTSVSRSTGRSRSGTRG